MVKVNNDIRDVELQNKINKFKDLVLFSLTCT